MTDNAFKARDIGLRAQKKILSRMATKSIVKTFIDGTTASLLDNVYRLAKLHVRTLDISNIVELLLTIIHNFQSSEWQQEGRRASGQEHHQDRDQNRRAAPQQSVQCGGDQDGRAFSAEVSGKSE